MRLASLKRPSLWRSAINVIAGSRTRAWVSILALVTVSALLTAVVRAYNHATLNAANTAKPSSAPPLVQRDTKPGNNLQGRLSLQPEADRFRRRLGQRFIAPGRERATLAGTLTVGAQQLPVRIVRTQDDDGEQVEIALGGGPASLTWNRLDGAKSAGRDAIGIERSLIERIALDSPDQFIQAQLRGASYFTVARGAMPAEAHGADDYAGPVWDLVRIGEPSAADANRPASLSRLYYINSSTGLIDKIASQEQGDIVIAEVSNWINQSGEVVPTSIIWRNSSQVVMQLTVNNIAHGAR